MSGISTHVLDTANGRPVAGISVELYAGDSLISGLKTNADGRIPAMLPAGLTLIEGLYRLVFHVATYFPESFFPEINILFQVRDAAQHHHVPLLLSPFGYSTYRGT